MLEDWGNPKISMVAHRSGGSSSTYVRKVMEAMTAMLPHFFFSGQFVGFSGSSGPSQSTQFGSISPAGCASASASFLLDVELLVLASRSSSLPCSASPRTSFPL